MISVLAERTFFWVRASEWSAVGAVATAIATLALLGYAAVQVRAAKKIAGDQLDDAKLTRDLESRPYIIVDFYFRSVMISLSVKNIGRTPAQNVRVVLDHELSSAVMPNVEWQHSALFTNGVPLFAPGREMRFALDIFHERTEAGLPTNVTGTIVYSRFDDDDARPFEEQFEIDLAGFNNALLPPKDISDVGNDLEYIRKILAKWQEMPESAFPQR